MAVRKTMTGLTGLDEITGGGLPWGRPTLVCGGPGCGKTLLAVSFLAYGAAAGEPGILMSFDEQAEDLEHNSLSLGFDLKNLQETKRLVIDHVHVDRQEITETGDYDLEGLFIRLGHAVDQIKARRVVLDSIDTLFAGIPNDALLRSELKRLFIWLKQRQLTVVITAERGDASLTRHGIEEYVSDCVIVLEQRVQDELTTRRLRIVKYRGSAHGTNEYPFLIESTGFTLLPITSLGLGQRVSEKRISSGIPGLDEMLDGKGYYQGSSILISGGPGTGKTSIGAQMAAQSTKDGKRCLYFSFEESEAQLVRNMRTIGIQLESSINSQLIQIVSVRPTTYGLEMHLAHMMHKIQQFSPDVVIIDPLTALEASGSTSQSVMMVLRLIDYLRVFGATTLYLAVQGDADHSDNTNLNISSLMDTWISIKNTRGSDQLERRVFVIKSRGMLHSADVRMLSITADGVAIVGKKVRV